MFVRDLLETKGPVYNWTYAGKTGGDFTLHSSQFILYSFVKQHSTIHMTRVLFLFLPLLNPYIVTFEQMPVLLQVPH